MTQVISPSRVPIIAGHEEAQAPKATWRRQMAGLFDPASRIPTYLGIVVVLVGFVLIGIAWAKVAALLNVALQLPYLISAGFVGLALVMVGLAIIVMAARRQDAAARTRQLERLTSILLELQSDLSSPEEYRRDTH